MHFSNWKAKTSYTLGAELEVRIHDPSTFALKECSSQILPLIPKEIKPHIHQEFLECMLEFVTPVCENADEIIMYLKKYITALNEIGKKHNFCIATSGSHTYDIDRLKHIPSDRYANISNEFGIIMRRFHICGFHIHVGFQSGDMALRAYNYMLSQIPLFLALSANSPFYKGEDTGLESYRVSMFDQLSRAGIPYYFKNFDEIQKTYTLLFENETISSFNDIWWDIRLSPNFGTLEIRVCDASNDLERLKVLVQLYQAMAMLSMEDEVVILPHQVLKQNKWNAARHGLDGRFHERDFHLSIGEYISKKIETIEKKGIFDSLNISDDDVINIKSYLTKPLLSQRQREVFAQSASLQSVEKLGSLS